MDWERGWEARLGWSITFVAAAAGDPGPQCQTPDKRYDLYDGRRPCTPARIHGRPGNAPNLTYEHRLRRRQHRTTHRVRTGGFPDPQGNSSISKPDKNQAHLVSVTRANANQVVVITSRLSKTHYYEAYVSCSATPYHGGRVQLSEIKLDSAAASAGLLMGVRSPRSLTSSYTWLRVDPMGDRPITGSVAWRTYSVVLDVQRRRRRSLLVRGYRVPACSRCETSASHPSGTMLR